VQSQRCLLHCTVMVNAWQLKTYSTRKCKMSTLFSSHYLRNRSNLDIGVLGYIGIVQHKEHSPEVLSLPPGTPCIYIYIYIYYRVNVVKKSSYCFHSKNYTTNISLLLKHFNPLFWSYVSWYTFTTVPWREGIGFTL